MEMWEREEDCISFLRNYYNILKKNQFHFLYIFSKIHSRIFTYFLSFIKHAKSQQLECFVTSLKWVMQIDPSNIFCCNYSIVEWNHQVQIASTSQSCKPNLEANKATQINTTFQHFPVQNYSLIISNSVMISVGFG